HHALHSGRDRLWGHARAGHPCGTQTGRNQRTHPGRPDKSQNSMKSAARIEAFLEMMSVERGASENTLAGYRRDLEDAAESISGDLAAADSHDIRAYLDGIAARGFAASSQARKLSSMR